MEFVADFTLNNQSLNAQFDVSEGVNFDALFEIDTEMSVRGDGVIDVTPTDGVFVVTSTTYIHEQGIASDTWEIEHNLGKKPSITVVDSADTVISIFKANYDGLNKVTLKFNGEFTGKAYLN